MQRQIRWTGRFRQKVVACFCWSWTQVVGWCFHYALDRLRTKRSCGSLQNRVRSQVGGSFLSRVSGCKLLAVVSQLASNFWKRLWCSLRTIHLHTLQKFGCRILRLVGFLAMAWAPTVPKISPIQYFWDAIRWKIYLKNNQIGSKNDPWEAFLRASKDVDNETMKHFTSPLDVKLLKVLKLDDTQ